MTQALDMVCSLLESAAAGMSGTRSAQDLIPDHCGGIVLVNQISEPQGKMCYNS